MADNNNMTNVHEVDECTAKRIGELCDFILVNEDVLDFDECKKYIERHINEDITFCGDKSGIRFIAQKRIAKYIKGCPSLAQLFTFKSDNNFQRFRIGFRDYYYRYYYTKQTKQSSFVYPIEFEYVFDAIQEAIDFYTLYEQFSLKLEEETVKRATNEATFASKKAANDAMIASKKAANDATIASKKAEVAARIASENAKVAANEAANKAVNMVIEQVVEKKRLEEKITNSVDAQMNRVTSKMSETSVTILGIFSGIVLTFGAGLFYSSSVLESINAANFYKLLCASALIGLVCLHLIVVMFRFIVKVGDKGKEKNDDNDKKNSNGNCKENFFSDRIIIFVSVVLILIMAVSLELQIKYPTQSTTTDSGSSDVDVNINIDVSISSNDIPPNNIAEESSAIDFSTLPEIEEAASYKDTSNLNASE